MNNTKPMSDIQTNILSSLSDIIISTNCQKMGKPNVLYDYDILFINWEGILCIRVYDDECPIFNKIIIGIDIPIDASRQSRFNTNTLGDAIPILHKIFKFYAIYFKLNLS